MLLETLAAKQKEHKFTDTEFAQRLGVSCPLWRAMKAGRRGISLRLVRGVLRAFPELEPAVMEYLHSDLE